MPIKSPAAVPTSLGAAPLSSPSKSTRKGLLIVIGVRKPKGIGGKR